MRKFFYIVSYSLYIVFALGLFLHTSVHPQFFHKYTIKYSILLALLIVFFPIFLWVMWYVLHDSTLHINKMKFQFKTYQKIIIFIIIFSLIVILPIEFYLRSKYYNFESTNYMYTINNFDPFLQYKLTSSYTTNVDNFGFRGENISKIKPKGTFRIFILGGSTVLNAYTPYEQTAPKILETLLQKKYPDKKIEVINAGIDGYTSEHSLIQYLFKIRDFNPDMIIMWHGINDWYYSCSPPERAYGPFQPDYSNFLGADAQMAYNDFTIPPILSVKFVFVDFFIKFIQDNWYSDIIHVFQKNHQFSGYYTDATINKQYSMTSYPSLYSYTRNVQELVDATKADHVTLILGDQANLYSNTLTPEEKSKLYVPVLQCTRPDGTYPSLSSMVTAMKNFNNATKNVAQNNNIQFVDLAAQIPKNLQYFTDDVHYTPLANAKIATILYNAIVSKNYIH